MNKILAAALVVLPGFLLAQARQVQPPAAALLHLEGRVTNLGCGRPLAFDVVVRNVAGVPFPGGADLHVAGPGLNHPPTLEGLVRATVPAIAAGGSETIHLTATPVKVDCAAAQTFLVTLTPGANLPRPHPQWDGDALELSTAPPTSCSATGASRRLPHWDPRT